MVLVRYPFSSCHSSFCARLELSFGYFYVCIAYTRISPSTVHTCILSRRSTYLGIRNAVELGGSSGAPTHRMGLLDRGDACGVEGPPDLIELGDIRQLCLCPLPLSARRL